MARRSPADWNRTTVVSASTDNLNSNVGFIPSVTGALSGRLREDATLRVIPVQAGRVYDGDLAQFDTTASAASQTVLLLHRVAPGG